MSAVQHRDQSGREALKHPNRSTYVLFTVAEIEVLIGAVISTPSLLAAKDPRREVLATLRQKQEALR